MKSTVKTLALGAALLCLLAGGMALPASAAVPLTGAAVSLPWNSDNSVPAESIEAGTYSSNMLLGETQQLSPTVRPRNSTDSVIYLTDDSSVLTVSNSGVVQAVGVGTATVTAAAGNQICAYTISVSMDSTMIVTEMDLALSSNTIYVGNSVSASLQVRPSSASQYATISLTSSPAPPPSPPPAARSPPAPPLPCWPSPPRRPPAARSVPAPPPPTAVRSLR